MDVVESEKQNLYSEVRAEMSSNWRLLEPDFINVEINAFNPLSYTCIVCKAHVPSIVRCLDCSTRAYYCLDHWEETHRYTMFHKPEIWKVSWLLKNISYLVSVVNVKIVSIIVYY